MAEIKSMTLEQARSYRDTLKSQGKSESTSKEYAKVSDYIKVLKSQAGEGNYGAKELASSYTNLSRGVTETGGWTEQNLDNIEKYTGNRPQLQAPTATGSMSGGDIGSYLSSYQDGVYGAAGSPELRESIIAQLEPDMAKPEPLNRVQEYEKMRGEMGVADLETTLTDLKAQLEEQYATKRARTFDAEGKPVAMGVIAGRVGEIERQENERIDAIGRQINVINDQLQTSYNVIQTYMNYMGLDYQDAVSAYNTEFNRNLQIYNLIDAEMDEQTASARANLQVYTNAITSGNMNYGNLSPDQKLMINKLEIQSGLPVGFVGSLKMSPKDSILGTSSDGTQAWVIGADGNMKVINTGLTAKSTGTESEKLTVKAKDMGTMLNSLSGTDGKVSPSTWAKGMRAWTSETGQGEAEYVSRFGSYVNKSYEGWYKDYAGFSVKDSNEYYEG